MAEPATAVHQLEEEVALVPFANWREPGGELVVEGAEPAEPVDPGQEVAVPGDQPRGSAGRVGSRLGLLAGRRRIVGLAAACLHPVPPRGVGCGRVPKRAFPLFAHCARPSPRYPARFGTPAASAWKG